MLTTHGTMTVLGTKDVDISPAISGIAGLGHILLTIALIVLFIGLEHGVHREGRRAGSRSCARAMTIASDASRRPPARHLLADPDHCSTPSADRLPTPNPPTRGPTTVDRWLR